MEPLISETKTDTNKPTTPKASKNASVKIAIIVLHIIAIAGAGWYGFSAQKTINDNQKTIKSADAQIESLTNKYSKLLNSLTTTKSSEANSTSTTDATSVLPNASAIENIIASITSGNTAALEGYMASSVNVILAATEAYGAQTPAQAVADITSFIGNPTADTWDFDIAASIVSSYGQGSYGKYFPNNATAGKSTSGKVISFSYDANAKISTVFMATAESLLE